MTRQQKVITKPASNRASIRRRVKRFYAAFNTGDWPACFALIDPKLRDGSKIDLSRYSESLSAFKAAYKTINVWYVRISMHMDVSRSKQDARPFAYVYVIWQDDQHAFHMFRERWVKESDRWYTRVVGLVAHKELAKDLT
jgi:hypothetical protein